MKRRVILHRLRLDTRGATLVEFAFVAPMMCLAIVAALDIGHTLFTKSQLEGLVQKAGRDFTLEALASSQAQRDALDTKVTKEALLLMNKADIKIKRRFFRTFSQAAAAKAEQFTDTNKNSTCDAGEPYDDDNNNNTWDDDGGNAGVGGAKDAVVYTVTMTYPRILPVTAFIGGGNKMTLEATTVLRNQPYGNQAVYGPKAVRNCL